MKYRNIATGEIIEVKSAITGGLWELLKERAKAPEAPKENKNLIEPAKTPKTPKTPSGDKAPQNPRRSKST